MRIAMIAPFAVHPKGTTRWRVLPLARALGERGHQVRVIVPPYDWPQHGGQRWQDHGMEVINVPLPAGMPVGGHRELARRVAETAVAWRPDVVHCFKPKGYSGLAAWLLAQRWRDRLPLVMDVDDWEAGWNRRAEYPAAWRWFFGWQERWGLRHADAVTAASGWLAGYANDLRRTARTCFAVGDVFYLPNGVESASAGLLRPRTGMAPQVLLYTRFVEHTSEEVWQVWRQVLAEQPGARLLVAGCGASGEEARLARLAQKAGAGSSIVRLGWTPAASRPGLFAAADVALLPVGDTPLNRAKSPMRLVEMLAAGLPVATQAVGEYGVLVRNGETGLLAPAGDAAGLAAAVVRLVEDEPLRLALGWAAAQRMAEQYAWSKLVATALAAYEMATNRHGVGA